MEEENKKYHSLLKWAAFNKKTQLYVATYTAGYMLWISVIDCSIFLMVIVILHIWRNSKNPGYEDNWGFVKTRQIDYDKRLLRQNASD